MPWDLTDGKSILVQAMAWCCQATSHYRSQSWPRSMSSLGHDQFNSLAPGEFEWHFKCVVFKWILVIDGWGISRDIALICTSLDLSDDKSTLVQEMAWCHQATSHYLSQCWPRFLSPYGVTRPQWVNSFVPERFGCDFNNAIFSLVNWLVPSDLLMIIPSDECLGT